MPAAIWPSSLVGLAVIHDHHPERWRCWLGGGWPSRARYALRFTADDITMQKDGFSYGARWADANLLTENQRRLS